MDNRKKLLFRIFEYAPFILLALLVLAFSVKDSRMLIPGNLLQILVQAVPIALMAIGLMMVLVSGGMDMSAGHALALNAVVFGAIYDKTNGNIFLGVVGCLALGVLIGLFNGTMVGIFSIPPFIVTLAGMMIVQGLTLFLVSGKVVVLNEPFMRFIGTGTLFGVPMPLIYGLAICVILSILIKQTRFGLRAFAMGSNPDSSNVTGVPMAKQWILVYIFCHVCVTLSALLLVARASLISPAIGGITTLLDAVTATIVGGTSIYGGRGSLKGTLAGALIVSVISYALTLFNVVPQSVEFFKGVIIIGALAVDMLLNGFVRKLEIVKRS